MIRKKKIKNHITSIRNKEGGILPRFYRHKKMIRGYYEQLCTEFLEDTKLPQGTQGK